MDMNGTLALVEEVVSKTPMEAWWGVAALVVAGFAVFLFTGRRGTGGELASEKKIPDHLRAQSVVFDLYTGNTGEETLAAKCIVTGRSGRRLRCETVEDVDLRGFKPGNRLSGSFRPIKVRGRTVNGFTSSFAVLEVVDKDLVRFLIEPPDAYFKIRRRRHSRKRVVDQQFIRAKVWFSGPDNPDVDFMEGVPDFSVNSYDVRAGTQGDNFIVNISRGGMGIAVDEGAMSVGAGIGSKVVINLFMFSYRDKMFKPYWYAGAVRSLENGDAGTVRMGVEFLQVAAMDEDGNALVWTRVQNKAFQ